MDVVLILAAIIGLMFFYHQSLKLKSELRTNDQLLRETLIAHDRELADHRESVQELAVVNAKLQTLKSSTLTPDNAVPKDMHVVKVLELSAQIAGLQTQLNDMTCKFEESRGKQISERVRLGMIGEQFATIHENFKYDRKETKALLQPIDFVCFEPDEVVFVDIKTGNAQLSTKQRKIRDNIRAGRVRFEVFRIDENGAKWED